MKASVHLKLQSNANIDTPLWIWMKITILLSMTNKIFITQLYIMYLLYKLRYHPVIVQAMMTNLWPKEWKVNSFIWYILGTQVCHAGQVCLLTHNKQTHEWPA